MAEERDAAFNPLGDIAGKRLAVGHLVHSLRTGEAYRVAAVDSQTVWITVPWDLAGEQAVPVPSGMRLQLAEVWELEGMPGQTVVLDFYQVCGVQASQLPLLLWLPLDASDLADYVPGQDKDLLPSAQWLVTLEAGASWMIYQWWVDDEDRYVSEQLGTEPRITEAEKTRLKILARDLGYQVKTAGTEIRVVASSGDTVFANDASGYVGAAAMLEQLKTARDRGEAI